VVSEKPHYIKPRVCNESKISPKSEFIISALIGLKKKIKIKIESAKSIPACDVCLNTFVPV